MKDGAKQNLLFMKIAHSKSENACGVATVVQLVHDRLFNLGNLQKVIQCQPMRYKCPGSKNM